MEIARATALQIAYELEERAERMDGLDADERDRLLSLIQQNST